ncbi:Inner membrane protein YeiU [uncultured delta proteobacterium]|uniref:Inner membrane protein YeiU n=1 Tax=uncultured delta proteobacterium TaxID=34034 RepID=A0A212J570_9DELT|nr:Inner membrane protein YeiU [uncultured delta proteobacterium]
MAKRLVAATALTLFGACLMASYFLCAAAWKDLDTAVFYYFNACLVPGSWFTSLVAYTNMRIFDAVSFVCMGILYLHYFRQRDNAGKRILVCIGLCMLLTAIVIKQCGGLIPIAHPSPTFTFEDVNRVSKMVAFTTKDADRNSFPGDHGMMLMIFAAYMARYFGRRAFAAAVLIVAVFAMPRILSGAHWFSDVYMGSLSIACMAVSWVLLTPASDWCAAKLEKLLPRWFFPPGGTGMFGR